MSCTFYNSFKTVNEVYNVKVYNNSFDITDKNKLE